MTPSPEVGCGGWYERLGLKKISPRLPCGGDDPAHHRDRHPEIAVVHRELHAVWAAQVEACERLWSAENATLASSACR